MKFHTKKYDISKVGDDFDTAQYEISCRNGWMFSDGSHISYAEDYEELLSVISDIEPEKNT